MNNLNSAEQRPPGASSLEDTLHYIELRRAGHSKEDLMQSSISRLNNSLTSKVDKIKKSLLERQHAAEKKLEDLVNELESIQILDPSKFQCENIEQNLEQLNEINKDLNQTLEEASRKSTSLQNQKQVLKSDLQRVKNLAKTAPKKKTQWDEPLYKVGGSFCTYISTKE